MTHDWSIADGRWMSDLGWHCARCQVAVMYWADTRTVGPCGGISRWPVERVAAFRAAAGRAVGA